MEIVAFVLILIAIALMGYVSFQGLDLRKLTSWLYGVFGFLCGLAIGLLLSGNLIEGLKGGAIFAFLTLFGGATMRRHKQRYNEDKVRSLLLQYGQKDPPSLFTKLVKKLLGKYK